MKFSSYTDVKLRINSTEFSEALIFHGPDWKHDQTKQIDHKWYYDEPGPDQTYHWAFLCSNQLKTNALLMCIV